MSSLFAGRKTIGCQKEFSTLRKRILKKMNVSKNLDKTLFLRIHFLAPKLETQISMSFVSWRNITIPESKPSKVTNIFFASTKIIISESKVTKDNI